MDVKGSGVVSGEVHGPSGAPNGSRPPGTLSRIGPYSLKMENVGAGAAIEGL